MFGLSTTSHEGRFAILFDIGSASIGASIVDFKGTPSKLIWFKRFEYGYSSEHDYERYSKTMYATLLEAGMKTSTEGLQAVRAKYPSFSSKHVNVYCVLSPPWFFGAVHKEVVSKEKSFQVNSSILSNITKETLTSILKTQESVLWQDVMGDSEVLESYNDLVLLDGYPVEEYDKRFTKELSVKSYVAIVSKTVQKHIDEVIEKVFPNVDYSYSSSTRVFSGLKNHLYVSQKTHRSILVEVEEEVTGIAVLEQNTLEGVASIPYGTNHILRALAPNAKTAAEAKTALNVLLKKNTEQDSREIPDVINSTLAMWHQELIEKLRTLSGGVAPPTETLLVCGHLWSSLLTEALSSPWEMPGIKRKVELTVYPAKITSSNKESKETISDEDNRLSIFAYLLSRYTS